MSEYCNNCFCCGYYLVPRYKRLVNNIFSQDPQHGLDKNNLERLRFYAVVKPEKLDKSFRYMSEKIARYLRHRNRPYVILGINAMDDTMKSCYQQLNTFVDYYLVTLHLVLEETNDLELIEHAIVSFESFCEIREEAPNYQRNYEFFVDRFTQLCHHNAQQNQTKFRCLGLRGHYAFIRKTANDELQNDVWKYMNQIVPSICFNMEIRKQQQQLTTNILSSKDIIITNDNSADLAEMILKDLFYRAHLNNISACIQPILIHLDNHTKWIPVDFPKYIFSVIMNSIKHHNTYVIIDLLLNHLEKYFEKKQIINIQTSIMNVIHDCLVFAATNTGVGSTMFAGISSLLKFLKKSFQIEYKHSKNKHDEQQFQTAVINGIQDFTEKLPYFQMIEIFQYITTSFSTLNDNQINDSKDANLSFQLLLLRTLQQITLKKHSQQLPSETLTTQQSEQNYETTIFPHQLFDPLLKLLSTSESEIRLIVLEILQLFIDRRQYADKFRKIRIPKDISQLGLPTETKTARPFDISFMKKFGRYFLSQLYQCILMPNNTKEIFYAIYCLMNLVTLEANDQDALVDVIHFCFEVQSIISQSIDEHQKKPIRTSYYCIHALIAAYFNLISKLYGIIEFSHHVDEIIYNREVGASYLLPPNAFRCLLKDDSIKSIPKECLFSEELVVNVLNTLNYDTSRFNRIIHSKTESNVPGEKDYDDTVTEDSLSSKTDLNDESQNEDISYQSIRKVFNTVESTRVRDDETKRVIKDFRTKPFEELKNLAHEKQKQTDKRIEQLLHVRYLPHDETPIVITNENSTSTENLKLNTNTFNYPDLFTY